jgi:hypothetical protein
MGLYQTKNFCTGKETVTRLKKLTTEWKKIFACYSFGKRLISKFYRELKKLNLQIINIPMKKWAHKLNREFQRKRYKWLIST